MGVKGQHYHLLNNKRGTDYIYECNVIAQNLYRLRKSKKLTLAAMGEQIGFSRNTIYGYEQGFIRPSRERLEMLAKFFQVTPNYILTKHGGKKNGR